MLNWDDYYCIAGLQFGEGGRGGDGRMKGENLRL
jgi:hypothetical protein